jgi:hypothetical protein
MDRRFSETTAVFLKKQLGFTEKCTSMSKNKNTSKVKLSTFEDVSLTGGECFSLVLLLPHPNKSRGSEPKK